MTLPHGPPASSPADSSASHAPIPKRAPSTPVEIWACDGVVLLAGMDPDGATSRNGVGFSKSDGEFGHSLADQLAKWRVLSEKQFAAAIRLARKYRGQLPPEPEAQFAAQMQPAPAPTTVEETGSTTAVDASPSVWPAGENAPHSPPPIVSALLANAPAHASELAEARATLANIDARHAQIAGGLTSPGDPAHDARCVRRAEHERLAWTCQVCPLHPVHGPMRVAANNLCVGTVESVRQRAVVARLEGDVDGAAWREAWCAPPTPDDVAEDEAFRASLGLAPV